MGDERPIQTREVEFHLLGTLPDANPIVVKRGCYAINSLAVFNYCFREAQ